MAKSIDTFLKELRALTTSLAAEVEKATETTALDGLAVLEERILNTGRDEDGQGFKPYSKNPLPWFFFEGRPGVRQINDRDKDEYPDGISYADYKKLIGRDVGHVNFRLSGRMWNDIGLVETRTEAGSFKVTIGGFSEEIKQRMIYNDAIRPGWFRLSRQEQSDLREDFKFRISRAVEKYFS